MEAKFKKSVKVLNVTIFNIAKRQGQNQACNMYFTALTYNFTRKCVKICLLRDGQQKDS